MSSKDHERRANAYRCFLVRGWISRPVKAVVRHWEGEALNAVGALDGAFRDGEYFYDVDFDAAVAAATLAPSGADAARTASTKAFVLLDGTLLPIDRIAADKPSCSSTRSTG